MTGLPFRLDLVQYCADHRSPLLTAIFQAFTALGDMGGYILLIALVFVAVDKRLAVRLTVLTLAAMSLNHILKTLIANPRPFISDGSFRERWAVSPERATDLATEYSTPSGHAMAGAAFYGYLVTVTRSRYARLALIACVLLIGASRPYLGVHYVEDVLSGWVLGLAVALAALRYGANIEARWRRVSYRGQLLLLLGTTAAIWLVTWAWSDWRNSGTPPSAFVSYAGLLTGVLAAQPLEARLIRFDPRSGGVWRTALRYVLVVALVAATVVLLGRAAAALADPASPLGHLLRFLRYSAAGFAGLFAAPWLFIRLGLATREAPGRTDLMPAPAGETVDASLPSPSTGG